MRHTSNAPAPHRARVLRGDQTVLEEERKEKETRREGDEGYCDMLAVYVIVQLPVAGGLQIVPLASCLKLLRVCVTAIVTWLAAVTVIATVVEREKSQPAEFAMSLEVNVPWLHRTGPVPKAVFGVVERE